MPKSVVCWEVPEDGRVPEADQRYRTPPARVFTDMPIRCYDTPMRSSKLHGIGNDYVNGFAETVAGP